jgi:flavin reductase (DIM6/NTAB) family NADH-FMN oxidoreductase RutF
MIDATVYKNVLGSFPSGVTVITTLDDDGSVVGLTASAFSSLSMDPPLVLFCPNYTSDSYPVLIKQKRFAIHPCPVNSKPKPMRSPRRARTRPAASSGP